MPTPRVPRSPTVPYTLLTQLDHGPTYSRVARLVAKYHPDLADAAIAVAYHTGWRIDVDGQLTLGRMRRASALDRELHAWDLVLLLNAEYWEASTTTEIQRDALIDSELSAVTQKRDPETGDVVRDARGRIVYRARRPDVVEYHTTVERFGLYRRDLEHFARAVAAATAPRLPLDTDDDDPIATASREVH